MGKRIGKVIKNNMNNNGWYFSFDKVFVLILVGGAQVVWRQPANLGFLIYRIWFMDENTIFISGSLTINSV